MQTKRFSEMNEKQKILFKLISDLLSDYARDNKLDNHEGIKQIFEVFVTLTLSLKAATFFGGNESNVLK